MSDEEQERRFEARITDPMRRWKLSETDLYSRTKWVDYSRAKDEMFVHTDIPEAPWYVVDADNKKRARLNCIAHLLSKIPYEDRRSPTIELPDRQRDDGYVRPPRDLYTYVPDHAAEILAEHRGKETPLVRAQTSGPVRASREVGERVGHATCGCPVTNGISTFV